MEGTYAPRRALPHPIEIILLAREIDAPALLPSAMYDLSRYTPSQAALGCTSSQTGAILRLGDDDLLNMLRGREHASRFFSTFIVNELEGREPSLWCLHRKEEKPIDRRACQIAFETITFELLRDVNGVVNNRTSDPLYAISDAELLQTKEDMPGGDNVPTMRTCEPCRSEFGTVVDTAKEEFWRKLPVWFCVDVPTWG
ncbi:hypothetical protein SERLA73DRAFT_180716 [Serpula lacrymans var. lacrymans S7.3]|uniref:Uncharacterized protein n=2 Tax=Serpula lacrymans var. lacrymans TaxID=341189 RepID=F8PW64_SERL3|nr:uncharacterized protein SERLADRAFT_466431 [Serpula lacrymans var. lacrymans S7.9]EGO00240.1 hypothetical protein SERLA73DRAFT_180716 [Serpula lacrymans var. lacrymans S7.3]EGO25796.1 hypothetical protein SERLADRAFT_466431 [Serpula lacrymans var. lacrymans S7.9]